MIACTVLDADGAEVPIVDGALDLEERRRYTLCAAADVLAQLGARDPTPIGGGLTLQFGHEVGSQRLRLVQGAAETWLRLQIRPSREKLPPAAWAVMLAELEGWLAGLSAGLEGAEVGQVSHRGASPLFLASALAPLLPELERALRQVLERPVERARLTWDEVPLHRVRRVTRETLGWVSRHPDIGGWLDPWSAAELRGAPPRLPQRQAEDTVDHPANRYLSWLVLRVVTALEGVAAALDRAAAGQEEALNETALWCRSRAARLREGAARLERLWRRSFLRHLPREPATEAALLVVMDHPAYARVHRMGRLLLSPRFQLDEGAHAAATRPSYDLYELWCLLAVQRQLAAALPGWRWTARKLGALLSPTGTGGGARFTARGEGQTLTLLFNPTFRGYHKRLDRRGAPRARWSRSKRRRPDLGVPWRPAGPPGGWVCLDAKYRVGQRNLGDAFTSLHLYRDALRYEGFGGPCRAALLLAPSETADAADWFSDAFRERYAAGVWALTPGRADGDSLARWLLGTLRET